MPHLHAQATPIKRPIRHLYKFSYLRDKQINLLAAFRQMQNGIDCHAIERMWADWQMLFLLGPWLV